MPSQEVQEIQEAPRTEGQEAYVDQWEFVFMTSLKVFRHCSAR